MDLKEKRAELINYFKQTLLDQTEELKYADESQKELLESLMDKTKFSLILMEEGSIDFNGEKIELNDRKIELMYQNYFGDPS